MKKLKTITKYSLYFLIFSFIGWVIEFAMGKEMNFFKHFTGIEIPLLPIFGFGGILLILLTKQIEKTKTPFYLRGLLNGIFIIIYELISGLILTAIFGFNFWDYSSHLFNFMGIISLKRSLQWILAGYFFDAVYHRYIKRFEKQNASTRI